MSADLLGGDIRISLSPSLESPATNGSKLLRLGAMKFLGTSIKKKIKQ
jgi:hypothetical protein